jgi:hypothetical protein
MLNIFSIALSSIILLQSIGISINDISKIDDFIEHASFHNEEYGDNIFVFISKHYGDLKTVHEREHHDEKKEHEQLPFHHQSQVSAISLFILNNPIDSIDVVEFSEFKSHNFVYQEPSSSSIKESPFQPPRLS